MAKKAPQTINNVVVVSDTHCGCGLGLMPPDLRLDDGASVGQSPFQRQLWAMWQEFWNEWVPEATRGEPYVVVHNGDAIDGVHHNSTTQITHNLGTQRLMAESCLQPIVEQCEGRYFHIRGTEAHVGKSGTEEEALARNLKAIPSAEGHYARYDLWLRIGPNNDLIHLLHHIGTTGSAAYEATAVHKELTESFNEAARWGSQPASIIVRSHRHRHIQTVMPWRNGEARAVVTPAWQGKTPFAWKIPGARLATPQFGGVLIRHAHGRLFADGRVWTIAQSPTEEVTVPLPVLSQRQSSTRRRGAAR